MRYVTVVILYRIPDVQHVFSSTPLAPVTVLAAGDRAGQSLGLAQPRSVPATPNPRTGLTAGAKKCPFPRPQREGDTRGTRGGHAGRGGRERKPNPSRSALSRNATQAAGAAVAIAPGGTGTSTRPERLPPAERPGPAPRPSPSCRARARAHARRAVGRGRKQRDAPRGWVGAALPRSGPLPRRHTWLPALRSPPPRPRCWRAASGRRPELGPAPGSSLGCARGVAATPGRGPARLPPLPPREPPDRAGAAAPG